MFCDNCGAKVQDGTKFCPSCGAEMNHANARPTPKPKVSGSTWTKILCIVALIAIVNVLRISKEDSPKKERLTVQEVVALRTEPTTSPTEPESYTVGDTIKFQEYQITFVGVTESEGAGFASPTDGKVFVLCEFEIQNISDKDVTITSLGMFEAYVDDYLTSFDLPATLSSEKGDISGTIAPGKKTAGVVGYEANKGWNEIEIHFEPHLFSSSEIIFAYEKDNSAEKG